MQFDITHLSYPLDAEQARLLVAQSNLLQVRPGENAAESSATDEQLSQGAIVVMGAFPSYCSLGLLNRSFYQ